MCVKDEGTAAENRRKVKEVPYIDKLMAVKGIGLIAVVTVNGLFVEVGDIGSFENLKQLQKLTGYTIVSNESGIHSGESSIS